MAELARPACMRKIIQHRAHDCAQNREGNLHSPSGPIAETEQDLAVDLYREREGQCASTEGIQRSDSLLSHRRGNYTQDGAEW